jgi:hypothetical protein
VKMDFRMGADSDSEMYTFSYIIEEGTKETKKIAWERIQAGRTNPPED